MASQPPSFYGPVPQTSRLPQPIDTARPLSEGLDAVSRAVSDAQARGEATDDRTRTIGMQAARVVHERQLQLQAGEAGAYIADQAGTLTTDLIGLRQKAAPGAAGYDDQVNERIGKFREDVMAHLGNRPEIVGRYVDNVASIAANARIEEAKWAATQRAQKSVTDVDALQNSLQGHIRSAIAGGAASDKMLSDADTLDAQAIRALPIPGNAQETLIKSRHQERLVTAIDATIDVNPHAVIGEIDKGQFSELDDKVVGQLRERARVAADRIDNKIEQQANASSAVARAEAGNLIEDVNGATLVDPAKLQSYRAQAALSDKPEDIRLVHDLDAAIAKNAVTAKYDASPQADRRAEIAKIETHQGWQENNQLRVAHDQLQSLVARDSHAAEQDPVSLYQRQTGTSTGQLNLSDPAAMRQRFIIGDQAAQRFQRPLPMHFTEAEASDLRQQYNGATVGGKADFLLTFGAYGSTRAREMMAQIAPNKPELVRLAELAGSRDPAVQSLVREASDGSAVPMKDGVAGAVRNQAQRSYGPALARLPGDRAAAILHVATWIYAHRAAAAGNASAFDPNLAGASIAAALGGTGGKGGIGQRNGAAVVLPMGATQDDFDRVLTMAHPDEFRKAANGVPKWSNRDLTVNEFRDLVPVLINDTGTQTLYAFRSRGGSGYVKTERGEDYVLDMRRLSAVLHGRVSPPPTQEIPQPLEPHQYDRSDWLRRPDGTTKGTGFLGVIRRPDGTVSSEISVGMPVNGKEMDIPTMVPGLTGNEVHWLLTTPVRRIAKELPDSIRQKAIAHAKARIAAGRSPFKQDDER